MRNKIIMIAAMLAVMVAMTGIAAAAYVADKEHITLVELGSEVVTVHSTFDSNTATQCILSKMHGFD